jgi:hypothetical protein
MSRPRTQMLLVVGAAVLAVIVLAIVLIDGGDQPDRNATAPATAADGAQTDDGQDRAQSGERPARPATPAEPGAPVNPSYLEGPDEEGGAAAVQDLYGGLASALEADIVPVQADPRTSLEGAEEVAGLKRMCDAMSSAARDDAIEYARATARLGDIDWTCEKAVALLIRRTRVNRGIQRTLAARVVTVNVEGDQASATLSFGKGVPQSSVPLVKEDGEWKIGSLPGGSESGGE